MWARGEQRAHQPKGAVAAEELDRTGLDAPRRRVQPRSADLAASEGRAEVLDRPPSSGGMPGPVRTKAPPLLPAFTVFSGTDPAPAKGGAAQHLRGAGSAGDVGFGVASLDREVLIYVGYGCGIRITGRNGPAECGTSCPSAFVPNKRSISRDRVDRQKGLPGLAVDHQSAHHPGGAGAPAQAETVATTGQLGHGKPLGGQRPRGRRAGRRQPPAAPAARMPAGESGASSAPPGHHGGEDAPALRPRAPADGGGGSPAPPAAQPRRRSGAVMGAQALPFPHPTRECGVHS